MDINPDVDRLKRLAVLPLYRDERTGTYQLAPLADTLDEIAETINYYVTLPHPALATLLAVWLVETYCYLRFDFCGYLALKSATPQCGKTRLETVLALFAKDHPLITAIPTVATLFRDTQAVVILDEVDKLRNTDKDMYGEVIAVLDCGFQAGAVVKRMERGPGGFVVKAYPVYSPKIFAGLEALADTLGDRSFQIEMQRATKRLPRLNIRKMNRPAAELRDRLSAWAATHAEDLTRIYDELPDTLPQLADYDDRFQDISEPLVVIASLADSERPGGPLVLPRLLQALRVAARRREPSHREQELLVLIEIIKDLLKDETEIFISSAELLNLCKERDELSRIETGRALAGFLRHFDLFPGFNSTKTLRGYTIRKEWMGQWEARYGGVQGR